VLIAGLAVTLPSAQGADDISRNEAYRRAAALEALGRRLFSDPSLSASGKMSCATCHSPDHAFGPPNDLAVQLGGKDGAQPGLRAVPSLMYLQAAPQFTEHFFESDDDGDESVDNGPTGGLTWDGRVDHGLEQASLPLLSPFEMANDNRADVITKIKRAGYDKNLQAILGNEVTRNTDTLFNGALKAIEVFEQSYKDFYPYSSKYDAYLSGKVELTAQEKRGLDLFENPDKGNCAQCHISKPGNNGTPPQFTDYGLIALGVPRNDKIPANADPKYYDLGLCGPLRTDFLGKADYCGLFMTPTLRNIATRSTFFHNGKFHTLREVMEFYVQRDTNPDKWYTRDKDGRVRSFDDLPADYVENVNVDPPFGGNPGDEPALSSAEIDDVIAFLKTLTDGYTPAK
jgi:cytochrome c peroxidase